MYLCIAILCQSLQPLHLLPSFCAGHPSYRYVYRYSCHQERKLARNADSARGAPCLEK